MQSLRREATVMCVGIQHAPVQLDLTHYAIKQGLTIKKGFGRSLWTTWDRLAAGLQQATGSRILDHSSAATGRFR